MSATNAFKPVTPSFNYRAGFASQEMNQLLEQLPSDFSAKLLMTDSEIDLAKEAADKAECLNHTILQGLEAIGDALAVAGRNDTGSLAPSSLAAIGDLIQHLASEAQYLKSTEGELRYIVAEHNLATCGSAIDL